MREGSLLSPVRLNMATVLLILANALIYLFELHGNGQAICQAYGLVPGHIEPIALVSSMFLHDPSSYAHIGLNMAFLAVFGTVAERDIGSVAFLVLYFVAGIFGGLLHTVVSTGTLVGASGALYGVMAVAGCLRPRLIGFIVGFGLVNMWSAWSGTSGDVSWGAHIGGMAAGVIFAAIVRMAESEETEAVS